MRARAESRERVGAASRVVASVALYAAAAMLAASALGACSSKSDAGGASGAPCGAPPGDWQYLLSCDSNFGGLVHQCIDYYATAAAASAVTTSFKALCQGENGSVLSSVCPAEDSVGSCLETSSSGPTATSPLAALERIFIYGSSTAQAYQANCEGKGGVYAAPGASGSGAPSAGGADACSSATNASGGGDDSGVAFNEETVANGQVIGCTNYVGSVSQAQLDSVLKLGALTSPCPAAHAICSCAQGAGSGPFGTTPTLVYYETTLGGSESSCPSTDASCKPSYTPP
jgi:hypothetical protein